MLGGSIDSRPRDDQQSTQRRSTLLILGGLTINMERINSQLKLSREKAITSVDPEGGAERINSQLKLSREKEITSVDPGGGELTTSRHSVRSTGWPLVFFNILDGLVGF